MIETILIHFSGGDRPGLTKELTAILAMYDACVLDIGQAVVHETLSLGLLVEIPRGESFRGLQDTLIAKSSELGLRADYRGPSRPGERHHCGSRVERGPH
jgi:phosphoserine phosphatase